MGHKAATKVGLRMIAVTILAGMRGLASGQELEPRVYSPAPVGTNFVAATYGHSGGDFLPDPTLPIQNASLQFNSANFGYYHAFGLFGRQTSVALAVPYVWGSGNALVSGVQASIYRSGLADPVVRFSYILHGSPALSPQDFSKISHKMIVGASVVITAPLGQYDPRVMVNIGTNRWSFRPQVGLSMEFRKWTFDLYLGASFFTENSHFLGSHVRRQDPLGATQVHISRTFRPGMWIAAIGSKPPPTPGRAGDLSQNNKTTTYSTWPILQANLRTPPAISLDLKVCLRGSHGSAANSTAF